MRKRTILKALLGLAMLIAVIGWAPGPPTNPVGSWICGTDFLVTFNQGGTFTASAGDITSSVNHGVWQKTGLRTFESKDLAFSYGAEGTTEFIVETYTANTMVDADNLDADFDVTITDLDGNVVDSLSASGTCTRIKL